MSGASLRGGGDASLRGVGASLRGGGGCFSKGGWGGTGKAAVAELSASPLSLHCSSISPHLISLLYTSPQSVDFTQNLFNEKIR